MALHVLAGVGTRLARFIAAGLAALKWLRRRGTALRLDAAEGAAEFIQFAFVGELLALGNFDEFQNFIHLVVQLLQCVGDESGVRDGLVNRRGFGGAKIGGLDPLALRGRHRGARRRRTLLAGFTLVTRFTRLAGFPWFPLFALGKFTRAQRRGARLGNFRRGRILGGGFGNRLVGWVRGKIRRHFGVRRAEATGVLGFFGFRLIVRFGGLGRFGGIFRRVGIFFGRFFSRRTRSAATATATTTTTTTVGARASRWRGRL